MKSLLKGIYSAVFRPKVIIPLLLFLLLIAGGIFFWLQQSLPAGEKAEEYLAGGENVEVRREDDLIEFWPIEAGDISRGIIFYPGAQVEAAAYAGMAYRLAERGHPVFLVEMPFQIALLDWERAAFIIDGREDTVDEWALVGHSLGGAMASRFISRNQPAAVKHLILLAAYPSGDDDISGKDVEVLSLYGSEDGVMDRERLEERKNLLPRDAIFEEISGANHAGFGDYGEQSGDGELKMTRTEQQELAVELILDFID